MPSSYLSNANYAEAFNCNRIIDNNYAAAELCDCLNWNIIRHIVLSEIASKPITSASLAGAYLSWYYLNASEPVASAMYLDSRRKLICGQNIVHGMGADVSVCASRMSDGFVSSSAAYVIIGGNFGLCDMLPIPDVIVRFSKLYQLCAEKKVSVADIIVTERFDYISLLALFA